MCVEKLCGQCIRILQLVKVFDDDDVSAIGCGLNITRLTVEKPVLVWAKRRLGELWNLCLASRSNYRRFRFLQAMFLTSF